MIMVLITEAILRPVGLMLLCLSVELEFTSCDAYRRFQLKSCVSFFVLVKVIACTKALNTKPWVTTNANNGQHSAELINEPGKKNKGGNPSKRSKPTFYPR